jgi:hypothetical protein
MLSRRSSLAIPALLALFLSACHSGPTGTYSDQTGNMSLELKSGGKATLTFLGKPGDCTYSSRGEQLTVTCNGDPTNPMIFTVHDDGSLTGPPGGFIPALHKQK